MPSIGVQADATGNINIPTVTFTNFPEVDARSVDRSAEISRKKRAMPHTVGWQLDYPMWDIGAQGLRDFILGKIWVAELIHLKKTGYMGFATHDSAMEFFSSKYFTHAALTVGDRVLHKRLTELHHASGNDEFLYDDSPHRVFDLLGSIFETMRVTD